MFITVLNVGLEYMHSDNTFKPQLPSITSNLKGMHSYMYFPIKKTPLLGDLEVIKLEDLISSAYVSRELYRLNIMYRFSATALVNFVPF